MRNIRNRKLWITFALWIIPIALGIQLWNDGRGAAQIDYDPNQPPIVNGCVIRFPEVGDPYLHHNSAHFCTGINSVTVETDGDLNVQMDWAGPIIFMVVEEDETLTQRGIQAGPSGGLGEIIIRFYDHTIDAPVRADDARVTCDLCNIWVGTVHWGFEPEPTPTPTP